MKTSSKLWIERGPRFLGLAILLSVMALALVYIILSTWPDPSAGGLTIVSIGAILLGWLILGAFAYPLVLIISRGEMTEQKINTIWRRWLCSFAIVPILSVIFSICLAYDGRVCRNYETRQLPENCMRCCGLVGSCGCENYQGDNQH